MKKILFAALLWPLLALAQSYPSPTYQNLTVLGTLTAPAPTFSTPLAVSSGGTGHATASGASLDSITGFASTGYIKRTGSGTYAFALPIPVSDGGTNATSASGTALDNITGFASTGFLTRTGAGTYAFQSLTNGITLGNLATQAANTVLANATSSTAGPAAFAMPGCSAATNALTWTTGTGFTCNSAINAATLGGATFAAPGTIGGTTPGAATFTTLTANTTNPALTYTASGTGATARSYAAKFGDIVSVKDYGAVGNGISNDTAAFVSAIAAACTGVGGTVDVPAGVYLLSTGSINLSANNCYLRGAGIGDTQINTTSTTGYLFSLTATAQTGISRMRIDYTGSAPTAGAAIFVGGANNPTQVDVRDIVIGEAYHGIEDGSGVIHYYNNISIYNTVPTTGYGMWFYGHGNDEYVKNVVMNSTLGTQPFAGIMVSNNAGIWIDSVDVIHSGVGICYCTISSSDSITWGNMTDAAFDTNSGYGIEVNAVAGSTIVGLEINNSWTSSNSLQGILVQGSGTISGIRLNSHRAFNNGLEGIYLNTGDHISITNSDIAGNSTTTHGGSNGVTITGANYTVMTGNQIGNFASFGITQNYGIAINAAVNGTTLVDNNVTGNVNGSIFDASTATDKTIANNRGYNPLGSHVIAVGASPFTYTNNTGAPIGVIIGGSVTQVQVQGSVVSPSSVIYIVPQAGTIQVTYSSTPSMSYFGY